MPETLTNKEAEIYNLLRTRGPLTSLEIEELVGYNNLGKSASRTICKIRNKGYPINVTKMSWGGDSKYSITKPPEPVEITLPPPKDYDETETDFKIEKNETRWTIITTKDFQTPEEAMAFCGMDPTVWVCVKVDATNNKWDVTAKFGAEGEEEFKTHTNTQTKKRFVFERKVPIPIEDGIEAFLQNRITAPEFKKIIRKPPEDPHLLEIAMPDGHFGMLAWAEECSESYDTKIASRLFTDAGKTILNRCAGYNIEKIVIPIGNDLFHMNDVTGLTPKQKNRLDVDGRIAKVFDYVLNAYVDLITFCRQYAPVNLEWVRGNHDPESSWYAAKVLGAWYRNADDVIVNTQPTPRKHIRYGKNLIAWTHGDEEPIRDLAAIMAGEWPEDWANTFYREWHLGHTHKKKELFTVIGDELRAGVRTRVIPSLSAKDYWHTTKGYMSIRAAEGYLYSKSNGYSGHFSVNVFKNEILGKNIDNLVCNRLS